jgi:hypothetical protein
MGKCNPTSVSEDRTVRGWIVVHGRAYVKLDQYMDGERSWNDLVQKKSLDQSNRIEAHNLGIA